MPAGLKRLLTSFEVKTAPEMGWAGISNGRLLVLAEQNGFDIMVTSDTNIRFQNRLAGRRIALVVAHDHEPLGHDPRQSGRPARGLRWGRSGGLRRRPVPEAAASSKAPSVLFSSLTPSSGSV